MFENLSFKWSFRSYQQRVLDGADGYLNDGKINIVAAPGSGKTVLGLELIRRLGMPCIVFSPTTIIRTQWGERFLECFSGEEDLSGYVSYDLRRLAPLTSVTYQALYAALSDGALERGEKAAESLFRAMEDYGVGTICLDEAHHLQNEWQKALEFFLSKLKGKVKVVSLTATPPYDAGEVEWNRYLSVCGEIDEEIFVPELVKEGTLCPHQDYIYFSLPSSDENRSFCEYRTRVNTALKELYGHPALKTVCEKLEELVGGGGDGLYSQAEDLRCVAALCAEAGLQLGARTLKQFSAKDLPAVDFSLAGRAVSFLAGSVALLDEGARAEILSIFRRHELLARGKISLDMPERLENALAASPGKLQSIAEIASLENETLGEKLRLLVLTDYIRKDELPLVGTEKPFRAVSVVAAFEAVRRRGIAVGVLSGTLVILPACCGNVLRGYGAKVTAKPLSGTEYSVYEFGGGNREKVEFVGRLFEEGYVRVLVGTKALLGEGWDSPCVNAVILASFVGSFMLSNQVRGRAIRVDKKNPEKTANVWHLATAEPADEEGEEAEERAVYRSHDYLTLARRFECFVAPDYNSGEIENGIERITTVKPPFGEAGLARINAETAARAADREGMRRVWENALVRSDRTDEVTEIAAPRRAPVSPARICAAVLFGLLAAGFVFLAALFSVNAERSESGTAFLYLFGAVVFSAAALFACVAFACFLAKLFSRLRRKEGEKIRLLAQGVLCAMRKKNLLSASCRLFVKTGGNGVTGVALSGAGLRAQKLFHAALVRLLSPPDDARYVLIPVRRGFGCDYARALSCPEIFGANARDARLLADKIKPYAGRTKAVYTRSARGRKIVYLCKRARAFSKGNAPTVKRKLGFCST